MLSQVYLEVIIVSHGDERWLEPCVNSLEKAAGRVCVSSDHR